MKQNPPFFVFSSYNKHGGRTHPVVARRMNMILDMWQALMTIEQIAQALEIGTTTVEQYIRKGHRIGDPRVKRPRGVDRRTLSAATRKRQMKLLHDAGFSKLQIADRLDCHVRLVQMRLKEQTGDET
jgi:transposase